jgi:hypothetical protein
MILPIEGAPLVDAWTAVVAAVDASPDVVGAVVSLNIVLVSPLQHRYENPPIRQNAMRC